jgi:MFS family permease
MLNALSASPHYPWLRLAVAVLLSTIGGVGMWSVSVVLPLVQSEFAVARGTASLPYASTSIAFAIAGLFIGRWVDRAGIFPPVVLGACALALGFAGASQAQTVAQFMLMQAVIGVGSSVTFAPLVADTSHWFTRRRGLAMSIVASGNYFAGAIWSPLVEHFSRVSGWRATYLGIALFCVVTMLLLAQVMRRRAPVGEGESLGENRTHAPGGARALNIPLPALQALLMLASIACCVAMAMPQAHIVAYCGDLGYGPARGAQMLTLMLACGIVSRLAFGWVSDHIGGLRTLLLSSALQGLALLLFVPFNGLVSLYVISALFGLFQGGIVPSYAVIVREYFPAREAGTRISIVITASIVGMALGGWLSGAIFDWTGSYRAAFLNGIAWNLLNLTIAASLWRRAKRSARLGVAAA